MEIFNQPPNPTIEIFNQPSKIISTLTDFFGEEAFPFAMTYQDYGIEGIGYVYNELCFNYDRGSVFGLYIYTRTRCFKVSGWNMNGINSYPHLKCPHFDIKDANPQGFPFLDMFKSNLSVSELFSYVKARAGLC